MFQVHNAPTKVQTKIFDSEAKFQEFQAVLESSGNYRMARGRKGMKRGVVYYYRCNRIFSSPKSKTVSFIDLWQLFI
ncbi:hypothetical protein OESDEN_18320 [Oesophagostomum dentatum]|uniref:Uncharacterized protein n=1 Tax=Oesophagostomum dentatum TaxID=61180 RepID=A0A0B1SAP2_OESDE|nr:hypothetical protein OESDEN_18320 [Oesophagostomum dentatum]